MKIIYILIAAAVALGAYVLLTGNEASAPTPEMTDTEMEAEMDMDMESTATPENGATVEIPEGATVKTFAVDAFNYAYSETMLEVNEGDAVTINLTSSDGFHDWVLDEFSVASEKISTDGSTTVTFVADKAGTYEYYCSVGSHRELGMRGILVVK